MTLRISIYNNHFFSAVRNILLIVFSALSVHLFCSVYVPLVSTPGMNTWSLVDQVRATTGGVIIRASDLPITISSPGIYSIGENITWTGGSPAITINSEQVIINLAGHTIYDDSSTNSPIIQDNGGAIVLNGNMVVLNARPINLINGQLLGASHINFSRSPASVLLNGDAGIQILTVNTGCVVDNCTFVFLDAGIVAGSLLPSFARGVLIKDCYFGDMNIAGVQGFAGGALITSITVDHCFFNGGDRAILGTDSPYWIIFNSTFENQGVNGNACIDISNAATVYIEHCVLDSTGRFAVDTGASAINITATTQTQIFNTNIINPSGDGININGSVNVASILNSTVQVSDGSGIVINPSNLTFEVLIQSNKINSCTLDGINVPAVGNTFVYNNTVVGCATNYVNVNPVLITTTDASTATASYYQNVSR